MTEGNRELQRTDSRQAILLTVTFGISYIITMTIPFTYDQLNYIEFARSEANGTLLIQEYSGVTESILRKTCEANVQCTAKDAYTQLQDKKMISLDYVDQMKKVKKLSGISFLIASSLFGFITLVIIGMISKLFYGRSRSVYLVGAFVSSLAIFPWISGLPHSNGKFYYIFGASFALLIAITDSLKSITPPGFKDGLTQDLRNDALAVIHQKWTRMIVLSITIMVVFIGTTALTLWNYMNMVFGVSFAFYPFIGSLLAIAFLCILFSAGVLKNIFALQRDVEKAMGVD